MTSAKVEAKAQQLLTAGRVRVQVSQVAHLTFTVVGDSGTHDVVRKRGGWSCSCSCLGRCSHLTAAMRIAT